MALGLITFFISVDDTTTLSFKGIELVLASLADKAIKRRPHIALIIGFSNIREYCSFCKLTFVRYKGITWNKGLGVF